MVTKSLNESALEIELIKKEICVVLKDLSAGPSTEQLFFIFQQIFKRVQGALAGRIN